MQLHLTINEKLVESVLINSELKTDAAYMEQTKKALLDKYSALLQMGCVYFFYLDPIIDSFIS